MRIPRWPLVAVALFATLPAAAAPGESSTAGDERTVQTAGLTADGPGLVNFFKTRGKAEADPSREAAAWRVWSRLTSE